MYDMQVSTVYYGLNDYRPGGLMYPKFSTCVMIRISVIVSIPIIILSLLLLLIVRFVFVFN